MKKMEKMVWWTLATAFPHFAECLCLSTLSDSALLRIKNYVLTSGYWFTLCIDLNKAWTMCDPDEHHA